jgi:gamma-glutamyl-gamma-aminobutyrate hydrolase PuuD
MSSTRRVLAIAGSPEHWQPVDSEPYEAAIRAAGLEPVVIAPDSKATQNQRLLDEFAGLLLMGGSDVNPALYGEAAGPETESPDSPRDDLECLLITEALRRDMPLLGICRGLQILNVQQGGSLVQHLGSTERHRRRTPDRSLPAHPVEITPGTLLGGIAGDASTWAVNSRHHQAIARLGETLRVAATDPLDGTIEAVERPGSRFCIAVQWHPENQSPVDVRQAELFRAFAAAVNATA